LRIILAWFIQAAIPKTIKKPQSQPFRSKTREKTAVRSMLVQGLSTD
jgi:hypothetical protein